MKFAFGFKIGISYQDLLLKFPNDSMKDEVQTSSCK